MEGLVTRVSVSYSLEDRDFIKKLAQEGKGNETDVLRSILDNYLKSPRPPRVYNLEQKHHKIVAFYQKQVDAMDKLCRKYGSCPRVDLVREAIQLAREERGS